MSPAKCSTASACNNPSDSITEIVRLEQFDYYNQKQNEVLYVNMENMDFLPPTAPSLAFARETYTPYVNGRRKRRVNITILEEMLSVKPNVSVLKNSSALVQCTHRCLMHDQIIVSHTCFGGHIDANCYSLQTFKCI